MRTIEETKFREMLNDPKFNIVPKTTANNYSKGEIVKRKLDGGLYIVQPYSERIKTFSTAQLRLKMIDSLAHENRTKMVKAELIRRKALAK